MSLKADQSGQGVCAVLCVLTVFVLAFGTDGESELQCAAAVQEAEKR